MKIEKKIPNFIIYIRPTSPIRDTFMVDKAIQKFRNLKGYDSLVSVHEMNEPVHKKFFIKKDKLRPVFKKFTLDQANNPRQNFKKSYTANGYLDIVKTKNIISKKNYLGKNCYPFITQSVIDIDDNFDFEIAKFLISRAMINVQ